jgi:hypothetical protein
LIGRLKNQGYAVHFFFLWLSRRVSTTLRQVLTEFSEFFMCAIRVSSFHKKFRARIA